MSTKARGSESPLTRRRQHFRPTAPARRGRTGCTPAGAPGSRTAVLQRRALRGQRRLRRSRADPDWQVALAILRTHPQERRAAFSALRERHGFSEYAFHELAKGLRVSGGRAPGCRACADAGHPSLPRPQPGLCGQSPPRTLQESWPRARKHREQAQRHRAALRARDARRRASWLPDLARRPASRAHRLGGPGGRPWAGAPGQIRAAGAPPGLQSTRTRRRPRGRSVRRATGARRHTLPQAQAHSRPRHHGLDVGPASIAIVPREGEARLEPLCANCVPMRGPSAACNGRWIGKGVPPIPSTTTSGFARSGAAQVLPGGSKVKLP